VVECQKMETIGLKADGFGKIAPWPLSGRNILGLEVLMARSK